MGRVPEYQPITGKELEGLSQTQDHYNRALQVWMESICRLWRRESGAPGVSNDERDNVNPGTIWVDETTGTAYVNVDNSVGAAVWVVIGSTGALNVATVLSNGSATSVTDNTPTTVDTYTAPANKSLTKIVVTGDANATWTIEIDSTEVIEWRAADGNKTRDFDFSTPWSLSSGSTIDIKVEHFFTGETANFKATIFGY